MVLLFQIPNDRTNLQTNYIMESHCLSWPSWVLMILKPNVNKMNNKNCGYTINYTAFFFFMWQLKYYAECWMKWLKCQGSQVTWVFSPCAFRIISNLSASWKNLSKKISSCKDHIWCWSGPSTWLSSAAETQRLGVWTSARTKKINIIMVVRKQNITSRKRQF